MTSRRNERRAAAADEKWRKNAARKSNRAPTEKNTMIARKCGSADSIKFHESRNLEGRIIRQTRMLLFLKRRERKSFLSIIKSAREICESRRTR